MPNVFADEDRIIEVLTNLVGNAVKFTAQGGITISHEVNENEVITHVTDTGKGVDKDRQKYLFKKSYTESGSLKQSGLGLGLYISKVVIDESGGRIWVKSEEGQGSTFSFSLPVAK